MFPSVVDQRFQANGTTPLGPAVTFTPAVEDLRTPRSRTWDLGFDYRFTSAGTVADFVEALRLRQLVGAEGTAYQYERDVEQFFRHSPAVVRDVDA